MRRIALFMVVASTAAWATTVMVTGCSSSEATSKGTDAGKKLGSSTSSSGDDDDNGSSSSGNSSSGSTTSSSSSGGNKDGGTDASTSSGGLTSNANKITCGAKECTTAQNCCYPDGKQDQAACGPDDNGCGDAFNGFNLACDEKADCQNGDLCWWGDGQTTCADTADNAGKPGDNPNQPDMQICKTNAECKTGTCATKTCKIGPDGETLSVKLNVCGAPTNCQ